MRRLVAILALRCPRCLCGKVFHGLFGMLPRCPDCGLAMEREQGYFLGAMYFSYVLAIVLGLPVLMVLARLGASDEVAVGAVAAELLLLSPLLYRYSRVLWLHFDQWFHPR